MKRIAILLALFTSVAALADDNYKMTISVNTVATNGALTFSCSKNGSVVSGPTSVTLPTGAPQGRVDEYLRNELRKCVEANEGTLTEVHDSVSPPPVHGAALHDSTVEATANKNAASGYAGVDASSHMAAAQMPALTGDVTTSAGAVATTLATSGVSAGACVKPTVDAKGRATGCGTLASGDIPANAANTSGSAASLSAVLGTAAFPALTGDITTSAGALATTLAGTIAGAKTFTGSLDKTGQASIVADSAGINSTETVIVKSAALLANRLVAGTVIRATMNGTCTSTAANVSTFAIRIGTAGSTADTIVFSGPTIAAATTGTAIPFSAVLEMTVRTTGASATAMGFLKVYNAGATGISTVLTQVILPTMTTFNTTTASNIVSVTYKAAASTTTSTFKQAFIEVVNQ